MCTLLNMYRVTTINVTKKWIEWAEWAASICTANSPFPGHVYCGHPVQYHNAVLIILTTYAPFVLLF